MKNNAVRDLLDMGNYLVINKTLIKYLGLIETIYLSALIDKERCIAKKEEALKILHKSTGSISEDGYFKCSREAVENRVPLTSYQQAECRNKLEKLNLIKVSRRGVHGTNWYLIDYNLILQFIDESTNGVHSSNGLNCRVQIVKTVDFKPFEHYINKDTLIKKKQLLERTSSSELEHENEESQVTEKKAEVVVQEKILQEDSTPQFSGKSFGLKLSSVETKEDRAPRGLVQDEELEVLAAYQKSMFPGCTSTAKTIVTGIPFALKQFEKIYKERAKQVLIDTIINYSKSDYYRHSLKKFPLAGAPKFIFSNKSITETLLPLAHNLQNNGGVSDSTPTEAELRQAEADNKKRIADFMANRG